MEGVKETSHVTHDLDEGVDVSCVEIVRPVELDPPVEVDPHIQIVDIEEGEAGNPQCQMLSFFLGLSRIAIYRYILIEL